MSPVGAALRPAAFTEQALIDAILEGNYPPGSTLPGERELAAQLGVTRPTLRETMQRLARDGWLTIQQGKSTVVNDFWTSGGLNVLSTLVRSGRRLPADFIPNLLEVRLHLAPAYTRAAVTRSPEPIVALLAEASQLADAPAAFAAFDWRLHSALTVASGNPVYTFILNGFAGFYEEMACLYFAGSQARNVSRAFYRRLLDVTQERDAGAAEDLARQVMQDSIELWQATSASMES